MKNKVNSVQTPTIIDVEASGFGSLGYPIEVGVIRSDGARFCRLIKPFEHWTHWDDKAEALHGISREHLSANGFDGHQVCLELNDFLANSTVYSDGWVVDHPWLIKLFAASGTEMTFSVRALEYVLSEYQMEHWRQVKNRIVARFDGKRHRASTDAEIIQQTFMQTQPHASSTGPQLAVGNC